MAAAERAGATSAEPLALPSVTGGSAISGRVGGAAGALLFFIAAISSRITAAGAGATSAAFSRTSRGSLCFAESDVPAVCDPDSVILPAAAFALCCSSFPVAGIWGALATAGSSAAGRMSGRSTATRKTMPRPNTTLAAKASGAPHLRRTRDIVIGASACAAAAAAALNARPSTAGGTSAEASRYSLEISGSRVSFM